MSMISSSTNVSSRNTCKDTVADAKECTSISEDPFLLVRQCIARTM